MAISRRIVSLLCFGVAALFLLLLWAGWMNDFHPWNESISAKRLSGKEWEHDDFLACYLWFGGLLNMVIALFLGCTTRLWFSSHENPKEESMPSTRPKHWWLGVSGAIILAATLTAPRLNQSLWDDEQHTMLDYVHGKWMRGMDDQGQMELFFGQVSWWDTVMGYRDPNNHFLFSIAARTSLNGWRWWNDRSPTDFSEVAFRFPAFVLGLLAIPAWGWLARVLGMRIGAVVLLYLLALHPWFLRYISEGRGYAFALFAFPVCLGSVLMALRTNRWRWWLTFAISQVFLLLSWPGMGVPLTILNLAWFFMGLRNREQGQWSTFFAWGAANLISVGLFLQWFLPCAFQSVASDFEYPHGTMGARYPMNLISHLLLGTVWTTGQFNASATHIFLPLSHQSFVGIGLSLLLMGWMAFLCIRGMRATRHFQDASFLRWTLASSILAVGLIVPLCMWGSQTGRLMFIFDWYFMWLMPLLMLLIALAMDKGFRPQLMAALFLLFFGIHSSGSIQRLRNHPIQPLKESVQAMKQFAAERNEPVLMAHVNQMAPLYDSHCFEVVDLVTNDPTDPGLKELMQIATNNRYELLVNVGFPFAARSNFPELMALLDRKDLFESIALLPGQELGLAHEIFRYVGQAK